VKDRERGEREEKHRPGNNRDLSASPRELQMDKGKGIEKEEHPYV